MFHCFFFLLQSYSYLHYKLLLCLNIIRFKYDSLILYFFHNINPLLLQFLHFDLCNFLYLRFNHSHFYYVETTI